MKVIPLFFLMLGFLPTAFAQDTIRSGNYQELLLAVAPDKETITGYYVNGTGYDERTGRSRFSCIFALTGKKSGSGYDIQTWFPADKDPKETIPGKLKGISAEAQNLGGIHLKLEREHGGCWNVNSALAAPEGSDLSYDGPKNWIQIRVISAAKASFHDAPRASAKRKAYLIQGDGVGVTETAPGWVKADYQGKVAGWIQERDLYPPTPPR